MTNLANLSVFIRTWINVPFWEIVLNSTLVIALAAIVCPLLARHSAALRHRVWLVALTAALLAPVASLLLPQFMLPVLPSKAAIVATHDMQPSVPISAANSPLRDSTQSFIENTALARPSVNQNGPVASTEAAAVAAHDKIASRVVVELPRIEQLLGFIWLLGMVLSLSLFLMLLVVQRMRIARLPKIDDVDWMVAVISAGEAIGLQRPIIALQSDAACVPAVTGVLAPRLVIPAKWRTWSHSQRHCILLHELAHIKRRDVAAQLLGRLALIVYWFNPLVWYALRQLRAERELASDDCVLRAGQAASDYAEQLLHTLRASRPAPLEFGVAMAHSARLNHRVLAILDPNRQRNAASWSLTIILSCVAAALVCTLGTLTLTSQAADEKTTQTGEQVNGSSPVWQENYAVEFPGTLPVSVAFSPDGKFLLTGDTSGEIMALILEHESPTYRWKTRIGGSHPVIAYSSDQKKVYATTRDGIVILDAAKGNELERIEVAGSSPIALGVFPDKKIDEGVTQNQIAFGNSRGYFIESWVDGKLADTRGTIETSTVADDAKPEDEAAVPLAVDPYGRSAIMTGPIDATGEFGVVKGKNVVWAYVCGDYGEDSPGNRILVGHKVKVVSAAWSKEGSTAVTGDAGGRVIIWDANTMKETRRLEFGGRVAALAISDDGTHTAAYVLGQQGELYVWDTANSTVEMKPIHTDLGNFGGPHAYASLAFSPDGKRLAGSAIHKKWLKQSGILIGKVRVWELTADPKAQVAPKHSYVQELAQENSTDFVLLNNESLLMGASKEGTVDLRRISDGIIQARIVLGEFTIGRIKMSSDRQWIAMEQQALVDESATAAPSRTFDIGIYAAPILLKATIPTCTQLLDIASGGKVVAVVREQQIELWDAATAKKMKAAPFNYTQIDAAAFSPDGRLLAISDRNELVLWQWEEDVQERIELGRCVGSLAFSPNGKLLAEGPSPGSEIQIRDLTSKDVVQTLALDTGRSIDIPRLTFAQGGRVLVACDDILLDKQVPVPHRIYLWDTASGSLAHQIEVPAGLPKNFEVSPNGRHLIAALEGSDGIRLSGWRLDGKEARKDADDARPAATPR